MDMLASCVVPLGAAGVAAHDRFNAGGAGEDGLGMANAVDVHWEVTPCTRGCGRSSRGSTASRPGGCTSACAGSSGSRRRGTRTPPGRQCSGRRRSLFAEPQPFWDYWEGRRPVLDVEPLCPPKLISGLV